MKNDRYEDEKVRCVDVEMSTCEHVKMICADVKRRGCEDAKM